MDQRGVLRTVLRNGAFGVALRAEEPQFGGNFKFVVRRMKIHQRLKNHTAGNFPVHRPSPDGEGVRSIAESGLRFVIPHGLFGAFSGSKQAQSLRTVYRLPARAEEQVRQFVYGHDFSFRHIRRCKKSYRQPRRDCSARCISLISSESHARFRCTIAL